MKRIHNIFKVRLEGDNIDNLHATAYMNQQIPFALFSRLNNAVQDTMAIVRGEKEWREVYFKFTDKTTGLRYEQFGDDMESPCRNCVFCENNKGCKHPYINTKGVCTKPYRREIIENE